MTRGGTQYAPFPWRDPRAATASAVASRSRWSSYRCGTPRPSDPGRGDRTDRSRPVGRRLRPPSCRPSGRRVRGVVRRGPPGRLRGRRSRDRRAERVHARLDRGALRRARRAGGAARRASGSRCASRSSATTSRRRRSSRAEQPRVAPEPRAGARRVAASERGTSFLPEVHVRLVRHRLVQPLLARGGARRRRGARAGVQPAADPRRHRARQDAPAAGDRPVRPRPSSEPGRALRHLRDVHERVRRGPPRQAHRRVQAALPRALRRPARRRRAVPRGQGAHPGGVLPHLQHASTRPASRSCSRATGRCARWAGSSSACARASSGA